MLGTDKSRGYCLEVICADFLAGANLDNEDPTVLLQSMSRFFKFLPGEQRQAFRSDREGLLNRILPSSPACGSIPNFTNDSGNRFYGEMAGDANAAAADRTWRSS